MANWFCFDVISWCEQQYWNAHFWVKARLFPDRRPSAVILAEVKEKLSQMPAAKEIHEAYEAIERAERGGEQG